MASLSLNSPPSSAPSPERRMVFGIYIDPDFEKLLESSKTINTLIKNEYKIGNNKSGASSTASTYLLPNGKRYIVRKTPGGLQHGLRLRREIETYRILKMDPLYKQFVSNLVYADAHLAAGSKKSYFIFEHEDGTPLDEFIEKNKNTMTAEQVLTIYNYLQKAIDFLESSKVVHRDIKLDNILIEEGTRMVKLIDFGFSVLTQAPNQRLKVFCGTP
jgi:serine/threonine protein kinase